MSKLELKPCCGGNPARLAGAAASSYHTQEKKQECDGVQAHGMSPANQRATYDPGTRLHEAHVDMFQRLSCGRISKQGKTWGEKRKRQVSCIKFVVMCHSSFAAHKQDQIEANPVRTPPSLLPLLWAIRTRATSAIRPSSLPALVLLSLHPRSNKSCILLLPEPAGQATPRHFRLVIHRQGISLTTAIRT